jgi:hypothetical protein
MRIVVGFIALVGLASVAAAQTAPPAAAIPAPSTKPVDCRAQAQAKGLRGQASRDAVSLCVEELRTACLKEAIEKKIVGKNRQAFMKTCAGRPKAAGKDEKKS